MRYYPTFRAVIPHNRTRSDVLLTRAPLATQEQAPCAAVRLACVKLAASLESEPGSNSLVQSLFCRYSPELKEKELTFVFRLFLQSANIRKFF